MAHVYSLDGSSTHPQIIGASEEYEVRDGARLSHVTTSCEPGASPVMRAIQVVSAGEPVVDFVAMGTPVVSPTHVGSSSSDGDGIVSTQVVGPFPYTEASINLLTMLPLIVISCPLVSEHIYVVQRAYAYIGIGPIAAGHTTTGSLFWGLTTIALGAYALATFTYIGDEQSGFRGHPDDLASANWSLKGRIRFVFISEFFWFVCFLLVDVDCAFHSASDPIELGVCRGSAINYGFDFFLWAAVILSFIVAAQYTFIIYSIRDAVLRCEWNSGTREIFTAFTGIFLKAGWAIVRVDATINIIAVAFTEYGDTGNLCLQIVGLSSLFIMFCFAFRPVLNCGTKFLYNFWPMYFAIAVHFGTTAYWLLEEFTTDAIVSHEITEDSIQCAYLPEQEYYDSKKYWYWSQSGFDCPTFFDIYTYSTLGIALLAGLLCLVALLVDAPFSGLVESDETAQVAINPHASPVAGQTAQVAISPQQSSPSVSDPYSMNI